MRKLATCTFLNSAQDNMQSLDSPLQMKLIKMLGLKKYIIDNFVFRRKPSNYAIRSKNGMNCFYLDREYEAPLGYAMKVTVLETSSHSVPVMKLTPLRKNVQCTIVYAHGNASDMADSLAYIERLCQLIQAEYVIFDYSGYGESRVPDVGEEIICKDMEIVLAWLTHKRKIEDIVLWGFSLGTFPVLHAASKYPIKAAILQCPIASISCIFHEQLHPDMKFKEDHFANIDLIGDTSCKILILHSSGDEIIPISHAKLLFQKFIQKNGEKNIDFVEVSKIRHNSLHRYIVSPQENDLQKEVFNFLMGTIYETPKKESLKTAEHSMTSNYEEQILLQLQRKNLKQLEDLRMNLISAEIEELPEDMDEIVIDQETQQIQVNNMGKKMMKGCFCFGEEEQNEDGSKKEVKRKDRRIKY